MRLPLVVPGHSVMDILEASALSLPQAAVLPDYGACGLFALAASIRAFLDGDSWRAPGERVCAHDEVAGATVLVFILVDGLGDGFLQRHGAGGSLLAHRRARLSSVFPSTTASAVTTMLTGLAPVTHGLTGWHIHDRRFGGVIAPLPMRVRAGGRVAGPLVLRRLFPYDSIFSRRRRPSIMISPRAIAHSRFSQRHCRGAGIRPHDGLADMVAAIETAVAELSAHRGGYVHAYYPTFDALSHDFGSHSEEAVAEFWRIDAALGDLFGRCATSGTSIVVSADHGFIDSPDECQLRLEDYPEFAGMLDSALFGERRVAFCAVRAGAEDDFLAAASDILAGKGKVLRSADLLSAGLFGPGPRHPRIEERIGTHTLLMEPGWTIRDIMPGERPHHMIGVHGGLTPHEMWVPLITATM